MSTKQTKIVGLQCKECGRKISMKVAKADAELQNTIKYLCKDLDGPTERGCGKLTTQVVDHIYGEPAASRLRELKYE